ncbi:DUF6950 family protein [Elioraea sp.]|uniref:DUF6950 family protein n=1 Tax=Elioraea sp. TaxID=2185103 RepID=UPI0025BCB270|nr:hypothetical protein [Elioraea sp.]
MISAPYRRMPHWEAHFARLIALHARTPFAWGTQDCVTFAADAVAAITGRDPIAAIRGTWSCDQGARRALDRFVGRPNIDAAVEIMAQREGWPRVPALSARRGDILLLSRPREAECRLAVCAGERALCPGALGLVADPITAACKAWAI